MAKAIKVGKFLHRSGGTHVEGVSAFCVDSDRRCRLIEALQVYGQEVRLVDFIAWLVVNGSFVMAKSDPNDMDLVVVLRSDHELRSTLTPLEYNIISRRRVRKRHQFDILVARDGSRELDEFVAVGKQATKL